MTTDPVDRFVENARSNGTETRRATRDELPSTIADVLRDEGAENLVYAPDSSGLLERALKREVLGEWTSVAPPPDGETEAFAEAVTRADVGLLCADRGLASHGTVAVRLTSSREGAVSLMPPVTITVLDARNLHRESRGLFGGFESELRTQSASWVLVAGPSTTADLGSLVQGVHGPSRSHVIVMESGDAR